MADKTLALLLSAAVIFGGYALDARSKPAAVAAAPASIYHVTMVAPETTVKTPETPKPLVERETTGKAKKRHAKRKGRKARKVQVRASIVYVAASCCPCSC